MSVRKYEFLKKLLNEDMNAALPEVYMKPQGITYKLNNGVGYFRISEHLVSSNKRIIFHLIEEIRRKGTLNENKVEMIHIL